MEKITGFVEHIVFQNTDNGYTVLELSGEEGEIILVGMMKGITQEKALMRRATISSIPFTAGSLR